MVILTVGAYAPVDFESPLIRIVVAAIALGFAVIVLVHASWRRRRHVNAVAGTGRNTDPNLLRDTRIERWVGVALVGIAVVLAAYSGFGAWQTHQNVRANLAEKYGITAVENDHWTGSYLHADLEYGDGHVEADQKVYFEENGEPLAGDDIFTETTGGS